jgi:hypothetical protein
MELKSKPKKEKIVPNTDPKRIPPAIQTSETGINKNCRKIWKKIKIIGAQIPPTSTMTNKIDRPSSIFFTSFLQIT